MSRQVMHYDPFHIINNLLRKDINRWWYEDNDSGHSVVEGSHWIPLSDIRERTNEFVITVDAPGVNPDKIDIFMENNVLTVLGKREEEKKEEGVSFIRTERVTGSFERRFTLPNTADSEKITAQGKHGVLTIVIPKREKAKPKKIAIATKE